MDSLDRLLQKRFAKFLQICNFGYFAQVLQIAKWTLFKLMHFASRIQTLHFAEA
jgi:hypothetical protein